jgi:hypothetical protein
MFKTKADQKRELAKINKSAEKVVREFQEYLLSIRTEDNHDEITELYYDASGYIHQWTAKKRNKFSAYSAFVTIMDSFKSQADDIKSAPVGKVVNTEGDIEKEIKNKVHSILKSRKEKFVRGVELAEFFDGLDVSVNAHYVYRNGTIFIRCFYYLFGKITALNTIIAVAEEHRRNNK